MGCGMPQCHVGVGLMRRAPCNVAGFDSDDSWERGRRGRLPRRRLASACRRRAAADDASDAGPSGDNADVDESTHPDVLWAMGAPETTDRAESRRVLGGTTATWQLVAVPEAVVKVFVCVVSGWGLSPWGPTTRSRF